MTRAANSERWRCHQEERPGAHEELHRTAHTCTVFYSGSSREMADVASRVPEPFAPDFAPMGEKKRAAETAFARALASSFAWTQVAWVLDQTLR